MNGGSLTDLSLSCLSMFNSSYLHNIVSNTKSKISKLNFEWSYQICHSQNLMYFKIKRQKDCKAEYVQGCVCFVNDKTLDFSSPGPTSLYM